jgi:hypothetical protein
MLKQLQILTLIPQKVKSRNALFEILKERGVLWHDWNYEMVLVKKSILRQSIDIFIELAIKAEEKNTKSLKHPK